MTATRAGRGTALVTGASSGIGLASSVALAGAGFDVVATMRDVDRRGPLEDAAASAGVSLTVWPLDVTSDEEAAACFARLDHDGRELRLLVNNAGSGHLDTLERTDLNDLRACMEVNFVAVARLTKLALSRLRAHGGRVVTVTSVAGAVGQPFNDAYCAAKAATEALLESLAPVAARLGVHVSVVEPGVVATGFAAAATSRARPLEGGTDPYADLFEAYRKITAGALASGQSPEEVADVVVEAASAAEPRFRYQTSDGAAALVGTKFADLDGSAVQSLTRRWLGRPS